VHVEPDRHNFEFSRSVARAGTLSRAPEGEARQEKTAARARSMTARFSRERAFRATV
jgi:hypothetical protein